MNFNKPLVIDGAMGTELMNRGLNLPLPLWSAVANIEYNKMVIDVHNDYINEGCDIITTNTFRTTPRTYFKAGYSREDSILISKKSFDMAIKAAKSAKEGNDILIAGSISPLEDCYEPNDFPGRNIALKEFEQLSNWVHDSGVDIILLETMGNFNEITIALQASQNHSIPIWLSVVLKNTTEILDGTNIERVASLAMENNVDLILINCTPLETAYGALELFLKNWSREWGVYPNAGTSMPSKDGMFLKIVDDENFCKQINFFINQGASIVGSCCGSTPNTIRRISNITANL